jgi:hypothetical protein
MGMIFSFLVIPSFGGGAGQFGSLGVSWNTALPQHLSSSPSSLSTTDSAQTTTTLAASEDVATSSGSSHHEDDLGKYYVYAHDNHAICAKMNVLFSLIIRV